VLRFSFLLRCIFTRSVFSFRHDHYSPLLENARGPNRSVSPRSIVDGPCSHINIDRILATNLARVVPMDRRCRCLVSPRVGDGQHYRTILFRKALHILP
jgi:hypothetical protein